MPTVSASWKASLPIMKVGTWPVRTTIGIESISASVMPVTALVAPGPGGDEDDAGPAGRAGVALGGMGRALLVAHQDVADVVLLEDRVVDRQHRAARDSRTPCRRPGRFRAWTTISAPVISRFIVVSPSRSAGRSAGACPATKKPPLGGSWRVVPRSGPHGPRRVPRLAPMPTEPGHAESSLRSLPLGSAAGRVNRFSAENCRGGGAPVLFFRAPRHESREGSRLPARQCSRYQNRGRETQNGPTGEDR